MLVLEGLDACRERFELAPLVVGKLPLDRWGRVFRPGQHFRRCGRARAACGTSCPGIRSLLSRTCGEARRGLTEIVRVSTDILANHAIAFECQRARHDVVEKRTV